MRIILRPVLRQVIVAKNIEEYRRVATQLRRKGGAAITNCLMLVREGINTSVQPDTRLQIEGQAVIDRALAEIRKNGAGE